MNADFGGLIWDLAFQRGRGSARFHGSANILGVMSDRGRGLRMSDGGVVARGLFRRSPTHAFGAESDAMRGCCLKRPA